MSPLFIIYVHSCVVVALFLALGFVHVRGEAQLFAAEDDVGKNIVEIIAARGFVVETHKVTTADKYVLTMYRLPKTYEESQAGSDAPAARDKPAVVLQHGLMDSCFTFVNNFRNQSLAFVLADAGYDVWLGNNRGTTWSREHLVYTTKDAAFWNFTWEDMGKYDLPAEITYVLNTTRRSMLSYVGHSEGTTQAFVAFSLDQTLAKKVSYYAALAPVAWTGHLTARIFRAMATLHVDTWFQTLGVLQWSTRHALVNDYLNSFACPFLSHLCTSALTMVVGASVSTNVSRIPVYLSQTTAGTSVKNMAHYAQGIRDDTFASYDYGCKCKHRARWWWSHTTCPASKCLNKVMYGSVDPPPIPIDQMVYPRTGFYISGSDTVATEKDTTHLREALPSGTIVHERYVKEYSHLDMTWAYNANEKVYQDLLGQLEQYEGIGYTDQDDSAGR
ncbi:hypothetical protein PsorP6_005544 [Peronosclerospora sorghi]|uniref:Uncharacterized protein n=1 Tax=Peronosclerospora sorghi TaxID=230839 RepID=A0ACC0W5N0_9STRA|nr:hypothetical protein PsorP6_005544 [Peronosclerospora sorghi]